MRDKLHYTLKKFQRCGKDYYAIVGPGLTLQTTLVGTNPLATMLFTASLFEDAYRAGYRAGRKSK